MSEITVRGLVATTPRNIVTSDGLDITSFRFAENTRKFNRTTQEWENGDTAWFTVTTFRTLAENVFASVNKGDRVIVTGKLAIREWANGERTGTTVDIAADTVGHDLTAGIAVFTRNILAPSEPETQPEAGPEVQPEAE
ncbi:MAG: single-stranded DNA-binding protein [Rhodoglobus sp.]